MKFLVGLIFLIPSLSYGIASKVVDVDVFKNPQHTKTWTPPSASGTLLSTGALVTIGQGGTGVATAPTSASASAFAAWDANLNFSANSFISGYQTIATAASTTTLTVASPYQTFYTGSTTQTVLLPVTGTLVKRNLHLRVDSWDDSSLVERHRIKQFSAYNSR